MASISTDGTGKRRIQYVADKRRRTIHLGKVSQRRAETVKSRVEDLASASIRPPGDETLRWLAQLDDKTYSKLVAVGLVKPRSSANLAAFLDGYVAARVDVKPLTLIKLNQAKRHLLACFDGSRPLRDFTSGDAEDFRLYLLGKAGLAENTARRFSGIARQFFRAAIKRGLVTSNPFDGLPVTVRGNESRYRFISTSDATKIMDACPDAEWRLIFALARYGGLRCPSEVLALAWSDVDWERSRLRVPSPKTERYEGGESRMIPLFPELRQPLLDVFEEAADGATYVITRYRDPGVNLRTQLSRIALKAGLDPWPKLFQNLRSTRETELAEQFPIHVVCRWIGNSQPVAARHYLQLTDEHFAKALVDSRQKSDAESDAASARNGSKAPENAIAAK